MREIFPLKIPSAVDSRAGGLHEFRAAFIQMKSPFFRRLGRPVVSVALFLSAAGVSWAGAVTPEPADYAVGFGAATLAFVIWRNVRRSRRADRGAAE